jgi:hypothetical protein
VAAGIGFLVNLGWKQTDEQGNIRLLSKPRRRIIEFIYPIMSRLILFSVGFHRIEYRGVN